MTTKLVSIVRYTKVQRTQWRYTYIYRTQICFDVFYVELFFVIIVAIVFRYI